MPYPRHIVAAGCFVSNRDNDILLIRSPKRGWEYPGGQVEEGENIVSAVRREVYEESGIRIEIDALAAVNTSLADPPRVIFDFLGHYVDGVLRTSSESLEVGWFPKDRVLEIITHPGYRDRAQVLLHFNGRVVYRAYRFNPYEILHESQW